METVKHILVLLVITAVAQCSQNSHPATMKVTCDDSLRVYLDGKVVSQSNNWRHVQTVQIPSRTKVIGLECRDVYRVASGIIASFSNGMVTDSSWKCTASKQSGWASASQVSGGAWKPATEISRVRQWGSTVQNSGISRKAKWIWTSRHSWSGWDLHVYCRKELQKQPPPSVTMKVTCDDSLRVYLDGKVAQISQSNNWRHVKAVQIPAGTKVIGLECKDLHRVASGIIASLSNGIVTDSSWVCTTTKQPGWASSSQLVWKYWQPATEITRVRQWGRTVQNGGISSKAKWIWTARNIWPLWDLHVYCRKNMK